MFSGYVDRPSPVLQRRSRRRMPARPPSSTSDGSAVRGSFKRLVQLLDRKRRVGVDLRVARLARAPRGGRRAPSAVSNSAIRPYSASGGFRACAIARSVRSSSLHLRRRARSSASRRSRSSAAKRMNRNSSHANRPMRADVSHPVPHRAGIHAPRRGQEVAVQAGDDDDVALEPHADVDDERRSRTAAGRSSARS